VGQGPPAQGERRHVRRHRSERSSDTGRRRARPGLIRLLTDPFALTPGFAGPSQPSGLIPEYDPSLNVWLVPFPMAPIKRASFTTR